MRTHQEILKRARNVGMYIVKYRATVRDAAKYFGISKTTAHKDVTYTLSHFDLNLYEEVRKVIDFNISQRASRGGKASRRK